MLAPTEGMSPHVIERRRRKILIHSFIATRAHPQHDRLAHRTHMISGTKVSTNRVAKAGTKLDMGAGTTASPTRAGTRCVESSLFGFPW